MFGATTCCISLTIPTASSPHRFACGLRPFDKLPSASSGQAGQALALRLPLKGGVMGAGIVHATPHSRP